MALIKISQDETHKDFKISKITWKLTLSISPAQSSYVNPNLVWSGVSCSFVSNSCPVSADSLHLHE